MSTASYISASPDAAIQAALRSDWKAAIGLNLALLKQNPKDLDTLNRLGRAYTETGQKTKAAAIYTKVLRLDKFNSIATKNLGLLKNYRVTRSSSSKNPSPPPQFLEEPGITKTVSLIRSGDPKAVSSLHPGDHVRLVSRGHSISIVADSGTYLGKLPDDLSSRLRPLLVAGNRYSAWVKSIDASFPRQGPVLKIFIRETHRSPKFQNFPSFPLTEKLSYAAFTPPELVHEEKPDVSTPEEQDSDGAFSDSHSPEPGRED